MGTKKRNGQPTPVTDFERMSETHQHIPIDLVRKVIVGGRIRTIPTERAESVYWNCRRAYVYRDDVPFDLPLSTLEGRQ